MSDNMQAYVPTVGKMVGCMFVADMVGGFIGFSGESAVAVLRGHEKKAFTRGWGRNAEKQRIQMRSWGKIPRKKNFFMMHACVNVYFPNFIIIGCIIIWRGRRRFLAVWR